MQMTDFFRRLVRSLQSRPPVSPVVTPLFRELDRNLSVLRQRYGGSADFTVREFTNARHTFACVSLDNMVDKGQLNKMLISRILSEKHLPKEPDACFERIESSISSAPEQKRVGDLETVYDLLASGFALLFVDGCKTALALGLQDFPCRPVEPPQNEVMERASHEAFTEVLKQNVSLLRRRLKTPDLAIESLVIGTKSRTEVAVCYLRGTAEEKTVDAIRRRLQNVTMDTVLESGYLQPFLEERPLSLFSSVGNSERPDTVCAKLAEGRVAVLVDGTPFCLITPFLFSEHFTGMDDYTVNPVYATFVRLLKYLSFFMAFLLPGVYVAVGTHNPEVFPSAIFYKVVDAQTGTPFTLVWEALIIHTVYEIMREAGLRLPRSVGHAVSIVGALVIGEAAVSAGLIGAPMIIVVAVTALASYVIPSLYYPAAVLRLAFIVIGGAAGLFGVILLLAVVLTAIASVEAFGLPVLAPLSPFDRPAMRDTLVRAGWRTLSRRTARVQDLNGKEQGP